jgi:aromatic ring-cleaving dioxygenase
MIKKAFKVNSKLLPTGFPREFDAHIYFTEETFVEATILRDKIKKNFESEVLFVGDLIPVPIGPHTQPMFEVNFPLIIFNKVVLWLMKERKTFTVLVHPLSGDDFFDHTQGAMWLGDSIRLDYEKFSKITAE